jgi:hypothetical protein
VDGTGSEQGPVAGPCEYTNEPSGSIKREEFLDQLSECQLLKHSAPCNWYVRHGLKSHRTLLLPSFSATVRASSCHSLRTVQFTLF